MAQALLHGGQHLGIAPGLAIDHPVGMQPDPGEGGREQVAAVQAPQHRPVEPGEDAAGKQHGGGGVAPARATLMDLVERPEAQPAPGQRRVEPWNPKG